MSKVLDKAHWNQSVQPDTPIPPSSRGDIITHRRTFTGGEKRIEGRATSNLVIYPNDVRSRPGSPMHQDQGQESSSKHSKIKESDNITW